MATSTGWTLFGHKPKPRKDAVSDSVRTTLKDAFKGKVEPSATLRDDYRRYLEIKKNRAA